MATPQTTIETLTVPQLGEGLRRVRISQLLKQPGETVAFDEPIYETETDKATMEMESPVQGTLLEWLVSEGEEVAVHSPVARILSACKGTVPHGDDPPARESRPAVSAPARLKIAPRARALAHRNGLSDRDMLGIPTSGAAVSEGDVSAYLSRKQNTEPPRRRAGYEECSLSPRQRALNEAVLGPGIDRPIPALVRRLVPAATIDSAAAALRKQLPDARPSAFQTVLCCAVRAALNHEKFRSVLVDGGTRVRRFERVSVGFAIPLPDDELTSAVIRDADILSLPALLRAIRSQTRVARSGRNESRADVPLFLSSLAALDIVDAAPVIVPPAVAVLFVGAPHIEGNVSTITLSLAFDHRLINGAGAGRFLAGVAEEMDRLRE